MSESPSSNTMSNTTRSAKHSSWTSVAFIIESILLLVFLVGSLAVLTQVFSSSLNRSVESRTLDAATIAASSLAEHFAADPTSLQERTQMGDLIVVSTVTDEKRQAGTLYHAHIDVYSTQVADKEKPVYSLDTSSYQPEG